MSTTAEPTQATTGHDAREVANWFLDRADQDDTGIDHVQLHKLVYLAHGWHLTRTGRPLLRDPIEAWPYGPVIPALYREFKQLGNGTIEGRAFDFDFDRGENVILHGDFLADTRALLELVWQTYRDYNGPELTAMTAEPGTPWDRVAGAKRPSERRNLTIPNAVMKEHFDDRRRVILEGG
jgi:uncharacterized phage-associated protein